MAKPVLVAVADEDTTLQALTRELESRYGAHYQVVSSAAPQKSLRGCGVMAGGRQSH